MIDKRCIATSCRNHPLWLKDRLWACTEHRRMIGWDGEAGLPSPSDLAAQGQTPPPHAGEERQAQAGEGRETQGRLL